MLANIPDYTQRIQSGKHLERRILDALRNKGYRIDSPTAHEDQFDKIDGWWVGTKGGRYPVQVKVRESGDDIIFEIVADFSRNIKGRDLVSKASIYLVSDTHGTTRMYQTDQIKKEAEQILAMVTKSIQRHEPNRRWEGSGWEAKLTVDRATHALKLMAFFDPNKFQPLATWQLQLK